MANNNFQNLSGNQPSADCKRLTFMEDLRSRSVPELISIVILILFVCAAIFFGLKYSSASDQANALLLQRQTVAKISYFESLFVNKVLRAQGEVSYQDRLQLETAVASIGDSYITNQWHTFLNSKTEEDAQQNVLNLLSIFSSRISQ